MSRSLNKVAQHSFKSCLTLKKETRETFFLSYAVYFTVYHINALSRLNHSWSLDLEISALEGDGGWPLNRGSSEVSITFSQNFPSLYGASDNFRTKDSYITQQNY